MNKLIRESEIKFSLFQKMLTIILAVLFLITIVAMSLAVYSNRQLERTLDTKLQQSFEDVFQNVGNIFEEFEALARENIRKTSGLISLENVWNVFQSSHKEYMDRTTQAVIKLDEAYSEDLAAMAKTGGEAIARIEAASSDEKVRALARQEKINFSALQEDINRRRETLSKEVREDLKTTTSQIDERVNFESGKQVKDSIGLMGKSDVVLVGSQEEARRRIEEIQDRSADMVKESIQKGNSVSVGIFVLSMSVVSIIVVIISLLLTRSITKPITAIVTVLDKMAEGDLPQKPIDSKASDEIGLLLRAFNKMAVNLRNVTASRDELDQQIQERIRAEGELKKAYDQLQEAQSQLVRAEKMAGLGQLAAGVAHEINNPIGFVTSNVNSWELYTEWFIRHYLTCAKLKEAVQKSDIKESMEIAAQVETIENENNMAFMVKDVQSLISESKDGLERVRKIVLDLRNFAREDSGVLAPVSISDTIEKALSIVGNEIMLNTDIVKKYGNVPLIMGSDQKLTQVFINLLLNASQAMKTRGTVEIETFLKNNDVWVIVRDTGEGIPKEIIDKIFNPFFTTKPVGKGTGLGLSISYDIVKDHGGDIEVVSEVGKGTCFTIKLPVKKSEDV